MDVSFLARPGKKSIRIKRVRPLDKTTGRGQCLPSRSALPRNRTIPAQGAAKGRTTKTNDIVVHLQSRDQTQEGDAWMRPAFRTKKAGAAGVCHRLPRAIDRTVEKVGQAKQGLNLMYPPVLSCSPASSTVAGYVDRRIYPRLLRAATGPGALCLWDVMGGAPENNSWPSLIRTTSWSACAYGTMTLEGHLCRRQAVRDASSLGAYEDRNDRQGPKRCAFYGCDDVPVLDRAFRHQLQLIWRQ